MMIDLVADGFMEELQALAFAPHVPVDDGGVLKLAVEGEVGRELVVELDALLDQLAGTGVTRVVIDFSQAHHIDYRAVGILVARAETLRALDGDLKLSGLSSFLKAILRSGGAHGNFDTYASVDLAVASFNKSVGPLG